jgi:hypothetical protein
MLLMEAAMVLPSNPNVAVALVMAAADAPDGPEAVK